MMGEYIIYYRGRIAGGIYDDRLLVKPTKSAVSYMETATYEFPYEGAKEMLLVEDVDSKGYLAGLFHAMYDELPVHKSNKKPETNLRWNIINPHRKIWSCQLLSSSCVAYRTWHRGFLCYIFCRIWLLSVISYKFTISTLSFSHKCAMLWSATERGQRLMIKRELYMNRIRPFIGTLHVSGIAAL